MRFEFDPQKAAANLKKHRVALSDAEEVALDPLAIHIEDPDATLCVLFRPDAPPARND